MSWNYRIILHDTDPDPSRHWYGLHEVYYGQPGDPTKKGVGPTKEPITFCADVSEGKRAIKRSLKLALKTLSKKRWSVVLKDSDMAKGKGKELGSKKDRKRFRKEHKKGDNEVRPISKDRVHQAT